jgi:hypothetical protein
MGLVWFDLVLRLEENGGLYTVYVFLALRISCVYIENICSGQYVSEVKLRSVYRSDQSQTEQTPALPPPFRTIHYSLSCPQKCDPRPHYCANPEITPSAPTESRSHRAPAHPHPHIPSPRPPCPSLITIPPENGAIIPQRQPCWRTAAAKPTVPSTE